MDRIPIREVSYLLKYDELNRIRKVDNMLYLRLICVSRSTQFIIVLALPSLVNY